MLTHDTVHIAGIDYSKDKNTASFSAYAREKADGRYEAAGSKAAPAAIMTISTAAAGIPSREVSTKMQKHTTRRVKLA